MKEKIINILKSDLLFAIVLNAIVPALCILLTSFSYDNSNDYFNSILICRDHFYYNSQINYILAVVTGSAQYAFPDINCFVLSEVLLSYVSFTAITYVYADKFNKNKSFVFSLLVLILFALNHYSSIDSTKTAALLLISGFLLILNAIRNKRYNLPFWVGVLLLVLGSFYNYYYYFVALGFAVAFFLGDMIAKKKYRLDFQKFFWYFRPFLIVFILVTGFVVGLQSFSYSVNNATEQGANYYRYAQLTEATGNLPYPDYDDYSEQFESIGINDESEYELLKNGYYDGDKQLGVTALQLVSDIQHKENSKTLLYAAGDVFTELGANIVSFDVSVIIIAVYLAVSLAFILYHKNRFSFFPLFYVVTGYIAAVALRYFYDSSDYLVYGLWLMMIVMLLFSFNFEILRDKMPAEGIRRKKNSFMIISCSIMALLLAGYSTLFMVQRSSREPSEIPAMLINEIGRNPDCYYVMDPQSRDGFIKCTENYVHPLWGFREGYLENLDDFGYFHNTEMLRRRNLPENIYEAVLKGRKVYVIDKYITFKKEKYFNVNYTRPHEHVSYRQLKELDGYKVYEVKDINS